MKGWEVHKYHVCGNDFLLIDQQRQACDITSFAIKRLAHRRFGWGCDQVLIVDRCHRADYLYRVFNADGHEVGQCGNGALALFSYLHRVYGVEDNLSLAIGDRIIYGESEGWVQLGEIQDPIRHDWQGHALYTVDVGNPHAVLLLNQKDLSTLDLSDFAQKIEAHLGRSVNVSLVSDASVRIHERGVGETLCCGSAATVIGAITMPQNHLGSYKIEMPGGVLELERRDHKIWLRGPVVYVGQGHWFGA